MGFSLAIPEWYHCWVALTVRTDEAMEKALDALVSSEGLSRQEIIRRAVMERYEHSSHVSRVESSATRMMERWGDVLERLSST